MYIAHQREACFLNVLQNYPFLILFARCILVGRQFSTAGIPGLWAYSPNHTQTTLVFIFHTGGYQRSLQQDLCHYLHQLPQCLPHLDPGKICQAIPSSRNFNRLTKNIF